MRTRFTKGAFEVAAGQTVAGHVERHHAFQILSGCAWVTVEGTSHDYWLSAGDEFVMPPNRLTVIQAEREAVVLKARPVLLKLGWPRFVEWLGGRKTVLPAPAMRRCGAN